MYKDNRILAIIPARGGSKGLPGKNIKPLLGKPLINWTIDIVHKVAYIDRVFVSTDSEEIAQIARMNSVEVPFLRNQLLAKDNSMVVDAVLEALTYFSRHGEEYDIVLLMEPTSPLRTVEMVNACIEKIIDSKASSLATYSELEVPLERVWCIEGDHAYTYVKNEVGFRPRQSLTKVYKLNGLLYAIQTKCLYAMDSPQVVTKDVIPYITPRELSTDIDDINDFKYIEYLISQRNER